MAITLSNTNVSVRTLRRGTDSFTLAAGKILKIETTPAGEDILEAEVPAGKQWSLSIAINIVETDAE